MLTKGSCSVLDLHKPFRFPTPFDWLLCLEVGEHIPEVYESIFIENLHHNCLKGLILSWSHTEGGDGHVNPRSNDYIISKFLDLGYTQQLNAENELRSSASAPWFKKTLMVFKKS